MTVFGACTLFGSSFGWHNFLDIWDSIPNTWSAVQKGYCVRYFAEAICGRGIDDGGVQGEEKIAGD
jgi:hypothetical protein